MVVSDYEMRVSAGSSGRTFRGFESFADAVSSGVDSFRMARSRTNRQAPLPWQFGHSWRVLGVRERRSPAEVRDVGNARI